MRYARAAAVATLASAVGAVLVAGPAQAGRLDNLIPNLYGGDGPDLDRETRFQADAPVQVSVEQPDNVVTGLPQDPIVYNLSTTGVFLDSSGFKADADRQIREFNSLFARQVKASIFPRYAGTRGTFVYDLLPQDQQDEEDGYDYERTRRSLGPIYGERSETLGAGRLSLGFNFTEERFRHLEGRDLAKDFTFIFRHEDMIAGTATGAAAREYLRTNMNIDFRRDVLNFYADFGLTNRLDVGLLVPAVQTSLRVNTFTDVVIRNPDTSPGQPEFIVEGPADRPATPDTFAFCNDTFVNDRTRDFDGISVFEPAVDGNGDPITNAQGQQIGNRITDLNGQPLTEEVFLLNTNPAANGFDPRIDAGLTDGVARRPGNTPLNATQAVDPICTGFEDRNDSGVRSEVWGIGDILVRAKFHLLEETSVMPSVAIASHIKFASGDARQFHGSGNTDFLTRLIVSKEIGFVTPHLDLGFEFTTGPQELDNVQWVIGGDVRLHDRVAVAIDFLGRNQFKDDGFGDDRYDVSFGGKVHPPWMGDMMIFGNAIWPLNFDEGLRSNVLWTVGLEVAL